MDQFRNSSTPSNRQGRCSSRRPSGKNSDCASNHNKRIYQGDNPNHLLPLEVWQHCFRYCGTTEDLTSVGRTCRYFRNALLADRFLCRQYKNPTRALLLYDGQFFEDVGPFCRETTVMHDPSSDRLGRTTVAVKRMDITTGNFTILLRYRVPDPRHARGVGQRIVHDYANQPLFHDWCHHWSFRIEHHPRRGPVIDLRRNINSGGAQQGQGLIEADARMNMHENVDAMDKWITCAFTWQPRRRELRCYCNGSLRDVRHVRDSVRDVTIQQNEHKRFFIGWKNDDTRKLHGEVSHLAVFKRLFSEEHVGVAMSRLMAIDDVARSNMEATNPGENEKSPMHEIHDETNNSGYSNDTWWTNLLDDVHNLATGSMWQQASNLPGRRADSAM